MTAHVVLLLLICVFALFTYPRRSGYSYKKNRRFLILAFTAIWFVQTFRSESVGWDTSTYCYVFVERGSGTAMNSWEFLYLRLMDLVYLFSSNPVVLMGVIALIIDVGIGYFILKNTPENESAFWPVFFFVTMTMYFSSMNLLRQYLSIAFAVNIYTVLSRDQSLKAWIKAVILAVIAGLFHEAGFISFILFIPFAVRELNKRTIRVAMIAAIVAGAGVSTLLQVFTTLIPRYSRYLTSVKFGGAASSGYYYLLGGIYILILFSFYFLKKERDLQEYRLMIIALISFSFILMQREITLAIRVSYLFEIFAILLIPDFMNRLMKSTTYRFVIKVVFFMVFWAYFIYNMTVGTARGCVPYTFFWEVI